MELGNAVTSVKKTPEIKISMIDSPENKLSNILNIENFNLINLDDLESEELILVGSIFHTKIQEIKKILKSRNIGKSLFKKFLKKYGFLAFCIWEEFKSSSPQIEDIFDIIREEILNEKHLSLQAFLRQLLSHKRISTADYNTLTQGIIGFEDTTIKYLLNKISKEKDLIKLYQEKKGYEAEIFEKVSELKNPSKEILYFVINNFEWIYKSQAFDIFKRLYPNDMIELAQNCEILTFQALETAKQVRDIYDTDKKFKLLKNSATYRQTKGKVIFEMPIEFQVRAVCEIDDPAYTDKIFENTSRVEKDSKYIEHLKYIIQNSTTYQERAETLLVQDYQSRDNLIFLAKFGKFQKQTAFKLLFENFKDPETLIFLLRNTNYMKDEIADILLGMCKNNSNIDFPSKRQALSFIAKNFDRHYLEAIDLLIQSMDDNELFKYVLSDKIGGDTAWEILKQKNLTSNQLGQIISKYGKYASISKQAWEILKDRQDNIKTLKQLILGKSYHKDQCITTIFKNRYLGENDLIWILNNATSYTPTVWGYIKSNQKFINNRVLLLLLKKSSRLGDHKKLLKELTVYIVYNYNIEHKWAMEIATSREIDDDIKHSVCGHLLYTIIEEGKKLRKQGETGEDIQQHINISDLDIFIRIFKCVPSIRNYKEDFCWYLDIDEKSFQKRMQSYTITKLLK